MLKFNFDNLSYEVKRVIICCFLFLVASPLFADNKNIIYPEIKGNYLVCPNGEVLSINLFKQSIDDPKNIYFSNDYWQRKTLNDLSLYQKDSPKVISMRSELIILKDEKKDIDEQIIRQLRQKYLLGGINVPTSYKDYFIKIPTFETIYKPKSVFDTSNWIYILKNSEGKTLSLTRGAKGWLVTDNQNNTFETEWGTNPRGIMYCTPNSFNLKVVHSLKLKIEDEYGENIRTPLMFWVVDAAIKPDVLQKQKKYRL